MCVCVYVSRRPTLSYALVTDEMQLADELPMIYTVCIMAFATFSYRRSLRVQILVAAALVSLAVFITVCASRPHHGRFAWLSTDEQRVQAYYLYAKDPVFHQVAYGLLTSGTVFRGFYVMEWQLRPKLSQRNPAECDRYMRQMYTLAATGSYHPAVS